MPRRSTSCRRFWSASRRTLKPGHYSDGGGLYLQVGESGSKLRGLDKVLALRLHGRRLAYAAARAAGQAIAMMTLTELPAHRPVADPSRPIYGTVAIWTPCSGLPR